MKIRLLSVVLFSLTAYPLAAQMIIPRILTFEHQLLSDEQVDSVQVKNGKAVSKKTLDYYGYYDRFYLSLLGRTYELNTDRVEFHEGRASIYYTLYKNGDSMQVESAFQDVKLPAFAAGDFYIPSELGPMMTLGFQRPVKLLQQELGYLKREKVLQWPHYYPVTRHFSAIQLPLGSYAEPELDGIATGDGIWKCVQEKYGPVKVPYLINMQDKRIEPLVKDTSKMSLSTLYLRFAWATDYETRYMSFVPQGFADGWRLSTEVVIYKSTDAGKKWKRDKTLEQYGVFWAYPFNASGGAYFLGKGTTGDLCIYRKATAKAPMLKIGLADAQIADHIEKSFEWPTFKRVRDDFFWVNNLALINQQGVWRQFNNFFGLDMAPNGDVWISDLSGVYIVNPNELSSDGHYLLKGNDYRYQVACGKQGRVVLYAADHLLYTLDEGLTWNYVPVEAESSNSYNYNWQDNALQLLQDSIIQGRTFETVIPVAAIRNMQLH